MVLIVGYGSEKNQQGIVTDYWLVQNSWGSSWGDEGRFKIARGRNLCNIASDVWSPVVKPQDFKPSKVRKSPEFCERSDKVSGTTGVEKIFCVMEKVRNV